MSDIPPNAGRGMHRKTITRVDLVAAVCRNVRLSRVAAVTLVGQILTEITNCLERGEDVRLASFGTFVVRDKGLRMGRNPKTGVPAPIPPRRILRFKPSRKLTRRINDPRDGEDVNGTMNSGYDGAGKADAPGRLSI